VAKEKIAAVVVVLFGVGVWLWVREVRRPELFKSCTSPDGTWSVEIYRASQGPLFSTSDLFARVALRDGSASYERSLYNLDMWEDAERKFHDLVCGDLEARLGPHGAGGGPPFVMDKPGR